MPRLAFFLLPTTVLAGAYSYVLMRGLLPFGVSVLGCLGLALGFSFLHVAGFGLRVASREGPFSDALTWVSYIALGWFGFAFVLSGLRDVAWVIAWLAEWGVGGLLPEGPALVVLEQQVNLTVLAATVLCTALGFIEARRRPRIRRVDVPIQNLPDVFHHFTLAQLSDVHVGPTIRRGFVEGLVEGVLAERPDAICITGDLIDGSVETLRDHTAPLANLKAPHGVYFVTGNHEYYSGAEAWVAEVRRLGITALMNEHVVIEREGQALVLAGVTDFSAGGMLPHHLSDPTAAFKGAPAGPRLLLAHQPRTALRLFGERVDLQLSGHTHGGQFWPWHLFVPLQQPTVAGLDVVNGTQVYTSRGSGYWGPPNRLGAPSEISLIRLVRAP